ncbi:hypothetical protein GCM10010434_086750 [Winogradskya humida]
MAMRHGVLPATLHVGSPSSHVDWSAGAVELLTGNRPWPLADRPWRAGVSSFGVSGTNAHVIIEQAPETQPEEGSSFDGLVPWVLSARSPEALREQAARLASFADGHSPVDVGFSLATSRAALEHRAIVVASDVAEFRQALTALPVVGEAAPSRLAFLFSGQGSQRLGMGRELAGRFPVFAAAHDEVLSYFDPSVREVADAESLNETAVTQPALFAVEVALFRLLESWGIRPDVLAGHSIGELAAAYVSGVWSLEDATRVVSARGRLMQALPSGGAMVAIQASEADVVPDLSGAVGLAAVNGPTSVVLSGVAADVDAVAEKWRDAGRKVTRLKVSHAFHSPLMEPMLDDFRRVLEGVSFGTPTIPIVSAGEITSPEYWVRHVRDVVRFGDAVAATGADVFLEIGPGGVLSALGQESLPDAAFVPVLRTDRSEELAVVSAVGRLHVRGVAVDWAAYFAGLGARRVDLPTYAFQRERYWLDVPASVGDITAAGLGAAEHPLLGATVVLGGTNGALLTGRLSVRTHPWLADHVVHGKVLLPGTAFAELAIRAGDQVGCDVVEELTLEAPLVLPAGGATLLQVWIGASDDSGRHELTCYTGGDGSDDGRSWVRHATGVLSSGGSGAGVSLSDWPPAGADVVDLDEVDDRLIAAGFEYGQAFQGLRAAWRQGDNVYAEVDLPDGLGVDGFGLHPALLDAALHCLAPAAGQMPSAWSGVRLHASGAKALRVRISPAGGDTVSLVVADGTGAPVAEIGSLALQPVPPGLLGVADSDDALFGVDWLPVPVGGRAEVSGFSVQECPVTSGSDPVTAAHEAAHWALATVQSWLMQEQSRLVMVTRGAVAVAAGERVDVAQAVVWGLVRSAQSENPDRFVLIDLDEGEFSPEVLASGESQLAVRSGVVSVPRLARVERSVVQDPGFGPNAVLVTGATGTLGGLVARHLVAERGVRSLVLVSRSGMAAEGAAELRDELVALGADVVLEACDVADRDAVAALLAGHEISAVVHTAGLLDDATIGSLTPERIDTVFRSKVDAAWNLHDLTKHADLSAFVLFSSVAGTLGGPGQGNYAAANAFLDALAHHRRTAGLPATALAWGLWEQTGGMTGQLGEADRKRMSRGGLIPIRPAQGLTLFDAAGTTGRASLVPLALDLVAIRRQARTAPIPHLLRGLVRTTARRTAETGTAAGSSLAQSLAGRSGAERKRALLTLVLDHVAVVLGHGSGQAIAPDRAFKDLGFDSLTAVELRNRLGVVTELRLPTTLVFDHPTPAALVSYLSMELAGGSVAAALTRTVPAVIDEPIAIVAMSCRFPGGVESPEDLWRLLESGEDAVSGFPTDRGWDLETLYDPDSTSARTTYSRMGAFLDRVSEFDADFFGISPREALAMDPQQRLLLETSWEMFERAGVDPAALRGAPVGVFIGSNSQDYGMTLGGVFEEIGGYLATGNAASVASGRLSYTFGFEGPALTIDTACSSSLVALHLAVQSLRSGECEMALAGGVTVMSTPTLFVEFSRQRGLSVDGRCKAFSDSADGTGWGEGVGMLLVERLSDAERNGHQVLAVVRGSAVNQDGASNGLTAPNGPSQQRVIRQALTSADLEPADVDAVEAHGTGTKLGDPIEAQALLATYGQGRSAELPLWLGSIKSNIGHTQAAAGVAGVIKMVMAMRHGMLPRTLHVTEPSSHVDWTAGAVEVLTRPQPWPETGRARRAGVSSFGISGTNAHTIIEQAPAARPAAAPEPVPALPVLPWLLSARSAAALHAQAGRLGTHLEAHDELSPLDIGLSLTARPALDHRAGLVGPGPAADLRALAGGDAAPTVVRGVADLRGGTVFVFPGQGSQWAGMAAGLIESSPVFAERMRECATALSAYVDWSLPDVLGDAEALERVDVVQPALWAVMVSLAELWRSCGLEPDAVVGHSQGEIAAACVAGALSLDDAAKVVALRSKAILALSGRGGMVSVSLPVDQAREMLTGGLSVAAVNGPSAVVVSGDVAELDALLAACEAREIRARRIPVDYASHSAQVESIEEEVRGALAGLEPRRARVPFYSTVTPGWLDTTVMDAGYWYTNLRGTVHFEEATRALLDEGYRFFVEASAHPVLTFSVQQTLDAAGVDAAVLGSLRRDEGGPERFVTSLVEGWVRGLPVDWPAIASGGRRVDLPTYAFQRDRYWPDVLPSTGDAGVLGLDTTEHSLLGAAVAVGGTDGVLLTGRLSVPTHPWLADHTVQGTPLLPGSAFVELAVRAGDQVGCDLVEELTLEAPLVLPQSGPVRVQVWVDSADDSGRRELTIYAGSGDTDDGRSWTRHATGVLRESGEPGGSGLTEWPPAGAETVATQGFYEHLAGLGFGYGPVFRGLRSAWRRNGDVYAEVALPDGVRVTGFGVHPALLDAALQAIGLMDGAPEGMPFAWSGVRVHASGATMLRVRLSPTGSGGVSLVLADGTGAPVATIASLVQRPVALEQGVGGDRGAALFGVDWVPAADPQSDAPAVTWAEPDAPVAFGEAAGFVAVSCPVTAGTDPAAGAQEAAHWAWGVLRAWTAGERPDTARLVIVTRDAVAKNLAHAAVWGLVRSAQSENPDRIVLVDLDDDASSLDALPAALATGEPELVVRAGVAGVPRLVRTGDEVAEDPGFGSGTVLVTGTPEELAGPLARHLVTHRGVRSLLLVSGPGTTTELRDELTALGADVTLAACEPGDRDALAELLAEHPVTAVLHTAGMQTGDLTPESIDTVLRPGLDAAWNLHELTRDRDLSAFVVFSPAATILDAAQRGVHAAANAFLNTLARRRRAAGLPGTALSWGLPADAAGLALFDAAGSAGRAVLAPMTLDLSALRRQARANPVPPMLRALVRGPARRTAGTGSATGSALARSLAGLSTADRDQALLDLVLGHVAVVLGHGSAQAIAPDRAFKDLGFDSLSAVELRNQLGAATGLRLPATLVFDHPSPVALIAYLGAELAGAPVAAVTARTVTGTDEPIAIVGMGCRYPGGVESPDDLWHLVASGVDAVAGFPTDRGWDLDALYHPAHDHPGTTYVRDGGFLRDADLFDPAFFGISPREAMAMDPQQRLLLEISWEALERAGIDPQTLRGHPVGVFTGTNMQDYLALLAASEDNFEGYLGTGNGASVMSGRLSYTFGFEGPAVTVDTACSSSLVALHLAAQALRSGECTLALAGGVAVMSTAGGFMDFSRQRGLSADGRCRAFSTDADGTGFGEGAGLLVLERLSDARRNGHTVLGIVRGSAINQDGASNGLTAPNGPSQQRVIRQALANARLGSAEVDAVEAHGTGTTLGDPIEAQALLATYGQEREGDPLWLGSLKSNFGHTQAAAGVAGVIKMVMAMRHGVLPRTLHVSEPTDQVDWSAGEVSLLTEARPWPATGRPRRAGVSSFGFSGTNAHAIIEQAPVSGTVAPRAAPDPGVLPLLLSARGGDSLRAQAGRLRAHLVAHPELNTAAVVTTLATKRAALENRAVVVGADRDGLITALAALEEGRTTPGVVSGATAGHRLAFLFSGQGSQRLGTGRELAARFPLFAEALDAVLAEFDPRVREVLFGDDADALNETGVTQPALFAIEVALFRLLESWGIRPDALAGHSIGELAAAYVAGVWSLPDAARVVAARGALMQALPRDGAMVALQATEAEVLPELNGTVGIAAVNGPASIVLSGVTADVESLAERWRGAGRKATRLRVSHAFHSPLMEPMLDDFRAVLDSVEFHEPALPIVSTLTGAPATAAELGSADYWVRHVRGAVRFADAVGTLRDQGIDVFLEVGPGEVLTALGRENVPGAEFVPALRGRRPELFALATAVGGLHVLGIAVDWTELTGGGGDVDLPTYAFRRRRFWPTPASVPAADGWRYQVSWRPVRESTATLAGTWLVVSRDGAGEEPVAAALSKHGARVLPVRTGPATDRESLAARLATGEPIAGVLSLLALDPDLPSGGVYPTLALVQALGDAGLTAPVWYATRGAVSVGRSDEPVRPDQAMVWGLARCAALEQPERWGGLVDLPGVLDDLAAARLAGILAGSQEEDEVALRTGGVFARRLVRAAAGRPGEWNLTGTVLVTGGTGGIGAHVARWLVSRGAEHLLLTSRRGPDAEGAEALRTELATLGARVTIAACDAADREALADLLASIPPEYPLTAVVHAAGVLDDGVLTALTPERFAAVLRPKVDAAINLDELTRDRELSAFVLFSSIAGTFGAAGQGNYATANAFLDALAERRAAAGLPATSVAWGPWGGGGMVREQLSGHLRSRGMITMEPGRAVAALDRAVRQGDPALLVADFDWELFAPARPTPLLRDLPDAHRPAASIDSAAPQNLAGRLGELIGADRERAVLDLVREQAGAVLGHGGDGLVEPGQAFKDLGFDSLTAVEFRNLLNASTGLSLPATLIFDYPTPVALAAHVLTELTQAGTPSIDTELNRLESALSLLDPDDEQSAAVSTRLRALLSRWDGAHARTEATEIATDARTASADELLMLLDDQLGRS